LPASVVNLEPCAMKTKIILTTLLAFMLGNNKSNSAEVDFKRDIAPLFKSKCIECHGLEKQKAGIRFDRKDLAFQGGDSGEKTINPGKPEDSLLIKMITVGKEGKIMPPKGTKLNEKEISLLKSWIASGANWPDEKVETARHSHWAFNKPTRPSLPIVKNKSNINNAIDIFIQSKLESQGLEISAEAQKVALLRRLSLDLIGLPPTPEEMDHFLNDKSPAAYDTQLNRLLASPRFGEKWARHWLDLARYADSRGYGSDPLRLNAWPFRDWVINAFNRNLSYDQFTIDQLAGDLLPNPTDDQLLATSFHRNTMTNTEGGTDDEEFRVAAVKDRADTTSQVWMGLTLGCAKCHSHKYDPISQREYYSFYGILNQTADSDKGDEFPTKMIPTLFQRAEVEVIQSRIADLKKRISEVNITAEETQWRNSFNLTDQGTIATLKQTTADGVSEANIQSKTSITGFKISGLKGNTLPPTAKLALSNGPDPFKNQSPKGKFVRIELPGNAKMLSLAEVQVFSNGTNIALKGTATQSSTDYDGPAKLAIDGNTNGDYNTAKSTTHTKTENNPWWEVQLSQVAPIDKVVIWNRTDGGVGVRISGYRVFILDESRNPVWKIDQPPVPNPSTELKPAGQAELMIADRFDLSSQSIFTLEKPAPAGTFFFKLADAKGQKLNLGDFKIETLTDASLTRRLALPKEIRPLLNSLTKNPDEQKKLSDYFRGIAPSLAPLQAELAKLEKVQPKLTAVPILQELDNTKKRKTTILVKGNFLTPGTPVTPGVPAAFHPLKTNGEPNRLDLAKWIVDPENPLTARVETNRLWSLVFGRGIVESEEDFGTQGSLPTHPELLDFLALEFMDSGWDIKAMLKLIMTSATYKQSAASTPIMIQKDPRNLLLGRSPRHRLDAEILRDQALMIGGLLSPKIYGPSVYPPQPANLWQAAFNGERNWATSMGEDKYRRGLYTFWRRTVPYPSMQTFDAPSREFCTVRRINTCTPLQAFVTLNDPVFVEAAQGMARKVLNEGGTTFDDKINFAWKLAQGSIPSAKQSESLAKLYIDSLAQFKADLPSAKLLAEMPLGAAPANMKIEELAAWTTICNVLLNLDGILTRS
jgi:mono/diheme cytochrome c family protein